jgi:Zn-finger nucleic acid-binding protein
MLCPVDGTTLALAERAGVEIDYCPQCRGVWLDRGELDRIIQRATADDDRDYDRHEHHRPARGYEDDHEGRRGDERDVRGGDDPRRKRRGALSALGDLFGGGGD